MNAPVISLKWFCDDNEKRCFNILLSFIPIGSSNDEDPEYFFDGDLDASAFRDDGDGVPVRASVSGQVFLSKQDFKKLSKLQKRGKTNAVQVKGFAVATGMKDACAGILEAKADLFFISSTFSMKYQGTMTFTAANLDAKGGEDGMIRIMGMINLRFRSSETSASSEKRSVGDLGDSGYIYLIYSIVV